jgi:polysaccharide export outer membrane protein
MPMIMIFMLLGLVVSSSLAPVAMAQEIGVGRLTPGDRVTVTVFGQAELSGTFQIDGNGFIELPLIGAVLVKQLTPKECEQKIGERLADGYLNRPVVSVSVGEVRPVYVLGDVRMPAAYPFRHGSSVLSAIAQAGGYGIEVGGTLSDFLVADERVRMLEGTRRMQIIRMARLEAQRDGKTDFTPPGFVADEPDGKLVEAVTNEREAMRFQQGTLKQELKLHREQRPRLEAAQTAIEQQIQSDKTQFAMVAEQLGDMEQLESKGLSLRSRGVALRREQAAIDSNMSRYRSELARLSVTIGELDIKINDTQTAYQRRILVELEDVRRKVQEIDTAMPTAREVRDVRAQQVANASGIGQAAPTYRILLSRTIGDEVKTLTVTGEVPLQPGDIVEVKRLRLENTPGANTSAPKGGGGTSLNLPALPPEQDGLAQDGLAKDPAGRLVRAQ